MGDLLALSARIIDEGVTDEPVNRITNELSELGDRLARGAAALMARGITAAEAGDFRIAGHLADNAGWAAPDDPSIHRDRAAVYRARRAAESSLMSKGIFAAAARESEAIAARGDVIRG